MHFTRQRLSISLKIVFIDYYISMIHSVLQMQIKTYGSTTKLKTYPHN